MKQNLVRVTIGVIVSAKLASMGPAAHAHIHAYTTASVTSNYGHMSSRTIVTSAVGMFAATGQVKLSALGTISGAQTISIAGNFFDETISGIYIYCESGDDGANRKCKEQRQASCQCHANCDKRWQIANKN